MLQLQKTKNDKSVQMYNQIHNAILNPVTQILSRNKK